jgi:hypothetical protein
MSDTEPKFDPEASRGDYWEDPVYRHLSRLHKDAETSGADEEVARLDRVMQELIDGSLDEAIYAELTVEARAGRKQAKQERKQRQPSRPRPEDESTSVNVADLKKRIYNKSVSKENMIKAIEALPPGERRTLIDGLSPGFRRKLGSYLTD